MMTAFLLPILTWAALFTGEIGSKNIELQWQGEATKLELAGKAVRTKKVAFMSIKVYEGSLYLGDVSSFNRTADGALNSLDTQKKVVMVMKFLREVDAKRVHDGLVEAFAANDIKKDTPGIKEFLNAVEVGGPALEGKTLVYVGIRDNTGETLIYQNAKGEAARFKGSTGFLKQIFSIWFGKMSEPTMENLKAGLLKQP